MSQESIFQAGSEVEFSKEEKHYKTSGKTYKALEISDLEEDKSTDESLKEKEYQSSDGQNENDTNDDITDLEDNKSTRNSEECLDNEGKEENDTFESKECEDTLQYFKKQRYSRHAKEVLKVCSEEDNRKEAIKYLKEACKSFKQKYKEQYAELERSSINNIKIYEEEIDGIRKIIKKDAKEIDGIKKYLKSEVTKNKRILQFIENNKQTMDLSTANNIIKACTNLPEDAAFHGLEDNTVLKAQKVVEKERVAKERAAQERKANVFLNIENTVRKAQERKAKEFLNTNNTYIHTQKSTFIPLYSMNHPKDEYFDDISMSNESISGSFFVFLTIGSVVYRIVKKIQSLYSAASAKP